MSERVKVFCKVSCPFLCPDFYSYGIFVYSLVRLYPGTTLSEPGPCHQSWYYTIFIVYSGMTTIHLSQPTHVNKARFRYFSQKITAELEWVLGTQIFLRGSSQAWRPVARSCLHILITYFSSAHNIIVFHCWSSEIIVAWNPSSAQPALTVWHQAIYWKLFQSQFSHL